MTAPALLARRARSRLWEARLAMRTRVTLLDSLRCDTSLTPAPWWKTAWWRVSDWLNFVFVCRVGSRCNFDTHTFSSDCLYFCTRCRGELTGRTFADLQPRAWSDSDFHGWEADL